MSCHVYYNSESDWIDIRDDENRTISKICAGRIPKQIISEGNELHIHFHSQQNRHSDSNATDYPDKKDKGFRIRAEIANGRLF